jgi:hypothetical protein
MREKPVTIEVRKSGQHWSVFAEEQLITQTVYEKGALTLEAVLRGLLRYTSRKLFRLAVSDAMKGPKPVGAARGQKRPKEAKGKATPAKPKAKESVEEMKKGARHRSRSRRRP